MNKGSLLSNVRVVELATGGVGPWAGMLLADLGAEVIKVESLTSLDLTRGPWTVSPTALDKNAFYANYPDGKIGERPWNRESRFNGGNFSKYDVTLDLKNPKGLQAFMRLVKVSDVFFSNMTVDVRERLNVTYGELVKVNPEIIYLSSTGYGTTGPYAKRLAMGDTIDAACGFWSLRDYGDGDSAAVSPDVQCDTTAAATNALSILMALYYRQKTGKGMFIDASMVEPAMTHIGGPIMDYTMNHRVQRSVGNRDISISPQGCYRCKGEDDWVTLSISSDEEWQRFAQVMGNPQLAGDERFSDVLVRLKNHDELDNLIEAWTICHTKFEVMNLLQEAGIAAGAVLNNAETYDDPHLKERDFFITIEDPDAGVHTYPGRWWKLGETQTPKRRHSPTLGEHNDYVLRQIIGLTPDEIAEFEQEGIIGTTPTVME